MTAIRHSLQRQLFDSEDDKLYAVINVKKAFKKKNSSFLGIILSNSGTAVNIVQIKESDRNSYKIKRKWPLSELKVVEGHSANEDTHELDLQLDKQYKWFTSNTHEREVFIKLLWKYCCTYLPKQKPQFKNFPKQWLELVESPISERGDGATNPVEDGLNEVGSYQAITESEESHLEKLMDSCQYAVSNAESFMDGLAKELSFLDEKNVHSMLSSEEKVEELMRKVEEAIDEAEKVDSRLVAYDNILSHIRDAMEDMEAKNLRIAVANKNNQTLLKELENIILQLDLPSKQQNVLGDIDLTTSRGLEDAIAAGKALMAAMNAEIHPALVRMQSVQDQRKRFEKCRNKFSQSILRHLSNLFISFGNDASGTLSFDAKDLTLPSYKALRQDLEQYTPLMHWLKLMDRKAFTNLSTIYVKSLGKLYERDITAFFEEAKVRVSGNRDRRGKGSGSKEDLAGKLKQQALGATVKLPTPGNLLGVEKEQWGVEVDDGERMRFDEVFERALAQLEPVCLSEQNFCVAFFKLDVLSPTTKNTQTTLDASADLPAETESSPAVPARRIEKQINEDVRRMMGELFGCLEPELTNFISYFEKLDGYYSMYVLVRLAQHVMSAQDTGSFLSMSFGTALVGVKRSFDKLMQTQLKSIEELRPNRKSKCGILPFVENFKDFVKTAESIFQNTDRRDAIDKWYVRLVTAMFEAIPRIGVEHPKTPAEVVKMENFHHLHDLLSQLKISVLENSRKEAKQRYNEALRNYVTQYFGRPLEKLNLFFEGVEAKVAQGVKESEVSYQMAFSKEQLRKVIAQYPAREVKRGLENLYRKVEKHLCEDVNLVQVVWRAMQNEFIHQYKVLEELMQRCYPGSMVTLEFSIDHILKFFSEIARSH